ncbi:hypothetical protein [Nitrosococcus wardiae]|uniref:hypothetical protein n=1 Tax=Nitrosococcus wardiae TaxID=1814290 RepID=UPI00141ACEC9|nr:hypothetical protein [Nitrosococcus wardiae]
MKNVWDLRKRPGVIIPAKADILGFLADALRLSALHPLTCTYVGAAFSRQEPSGLNRG